MHRETPRAGPAGPHIGSRRNAPYRPAGAAPFPRSPARMPSGADLAARVACGASWRVRPPRASRALPDFS